MVFDYLAIRLNGPKADGKHISLNLIFPDIHEEYNLEWATNQENVIHAIINKGIINKFRKKVQMIKNKEVIKIETGYKSKQVLEDFIKV